MGQDVLELLLRDHPDLSESTLTEDEIAMIAGMQEAVTQIRSSENEQLDGTILSDPFYRIFQTNDRNPLYIHSCVRILLNYS